MAEEEVTAGTEPEAPRQQFAMQRVYVKDLSFESPTTPAVFKQDWKPQMNVDLNTRSGKIDGDNFEVVLTLTITAKLGEETAFLIELQQAGIFLVHGVEGEELRRVLATLCPNMLFPYAREAIDGVITRGTFPALMLAPVNFDALYVQALQQAQERAQAGASGDEADAPEATH
jgi:preprotein translocase subunit SecB